MIEKVQSYKVGDKFFNTFEEARSEELISLFSDLPGTQGSAAVAIVVKNKDRLVDILTSTPRSRAKARKINGATRKRKSLPKTITASETGA
jgi:hypothetical protein